MNHYHWREADTLSYPVRICVTHAPSPMRPHAQEELEIMYFFETQGCIYQCGGKELAFSGGQMAVVNPHEIHACHTWGDGCHAVCMVLNLKKLAIPALLRMRFQNKITATREIEAVIGRLLLALDEEGTARDCGVYGCIYDLLSLLAKHAAWENSRSSERKNTFDQVIRYIAAHAFEPIFIKDLARLVHLSEDRFYHAFREIYGISPTEYILFVRISHACHLLTDTEMKITQIAQECGFCTASYFSKRFGEYMKRSPLSYRRKSRVGEGGEDLVTLST